MKAILLLLLLSSTVLCHSATTKELNKAQETAATGLPEKTAQWTKYYQDQREKVKNNVQALEDLDAKNFRVKDLMTRYGIAVRAHTKVVQALMDTSRTNRFADPKVTAKAVADTQKELLETIDELLKGKRAGISRTQR